jgi:hypothetical protein
MPVVRSSLLQLKSGFVREVASLEGDNLVVFLKQIVLCYDLMKVITERHAH